MSSERLAKVLGYLATDAATRSTAVSSESACDAGVRLADVTGVQLTLMSGPDRGESRYATDEAGARLEELRFTLGEGPCADAFRTGVPVLAAELDTGRNHRHWPLFVPAALEIGVRAVFAFPLRSGAIRMGLLVLHRARPGPMTHEQMSDTQVLGDVILSLLLDELTRVQVENNTLLADMPLRRAEVHQATGMLSVQLGVSVEEALVRLRAHAFAEERPVIDVARDVVARRLRLTPEARPDPA
ncbi:GAF and ANTAR domain-containing protein [Lentzea flaviverrucosa]|uniref:ANTAR domain-containing protein n=1 Tax=Lentzea flaviverrucosa TaxID=200379 RepID=A0A1H9XWA3_9PSEU|nr:GAF and ANTAR domain-containing protein [Lentzea flaviverrucosa]RDI18422.1 ANTAR domain-containing protein [Lentzea flaviverrucosa]SES50359.1 ANTAR domain-containing protein [Lentzea flaviverrucosa]